MKNLANDLLALEINTIVKENMSGAKMPAKRRVALMDIANRYRSLLLEYGLCRIADGKTPTDAKIAKRKPIRWHFAGEYSFVELRNLALSGIETLSQQIKNSTQHEDIEQLEGKIKMLTRVERQCSNLIGMFKIRRQQLGVKAGEEQPGLEAMPNHEGITSDEDPFPSQMGSELWNNDISLSDINRVEDMELTPDQITLIRKVWELGTQKVLLQTVIQIDGDITNYMTNQFLYLHPELRKIVLELHNGASESGTRIWRQLFATIGQLAGKTFNQLLGSNKK